jgi:hypothetical protein
MARERVLVAHTEALAKGLPVRNDGRCMSEQSKCPRGLWTAPMGMQWVED